jgi:hypothetical protein
MSKLVKRILRAKRGVKRVPRLILGLVDIRHVHEYDQSSQACENSTPLAGPSAAPRERERSQRAARRLEHMRLASYLRLRVQEFPHDQRSRRGRPSDALSWTVSEMCRQVRLISPASCPSPPGRRARPALKGVKTGKREPPSDAEIERGLRERAVTSARDAEVLLRWRHGAPPETTPGVDLESLSEAHLERLYAGFVRLASMEEAVLAALVEQLLAGDELGSSS